MDVSQLFNRYLPAFLIVFAVGFATALVPEQAAATSDPEAEKLMRQVYEQGRQQKNQRADIEMLIEDRKKRKKRREFELLYKIMRKQSNSLARFYKPTSVKGSSLLSIAYDKQGKATQQWIFLPAFRTVKKLNTEQRHESFMGSDFSNADIAGRKPSEDTHRIISKSKEITIVHSTPKSADDPYSKLETHIVNAIKVPQRIVFYNRSGRKLKTLDSKVIQKKQGMYVVMEAEMVNHISNGKTLLIKRELSFSKKIAKGDVSVQKLQNR